MSTPHIRLREYPPPRPPNPCSLCLLLDYVIGMRYVTAKKLKAEDSIIETLTKNKGKSQLTNSPKGGVMALKREARTPS